jgi:cation transporter-like permease
MQNRTIVAERWAARAMLAAGFIVGGIVGVFVAPQVQSDFALVGVDQISFLPAAPVVLACAIAGALLAHRANRRRKGLGDRSA